MISSLYGRYLRNDLRRNKGVTIALVVMLILSAFLMASGAMVMERLSGSVGRLLDIAKPPHFLQMHKGEYDAAALVGFAAEHPEIDSWLIEEMVGFDGQAISFETPGTGERHDLAESMIDNLFVTQNADFDFLLDQNDDIPRPDSGEIYVPVASGQQFGIEEGDRLFVNTGAGIETFEVKGFVRDAQMASSMSSATRFLISEDDFERIRATGAGSPEIIVEYRLSDTSQIGEFQRAYESDPDVPKNGQAVTEVMIRLVNMFSDGLVAIAFVFASLLLIAIALLNVRFVIRGTLEDDIHEIGAMKAIGIPSRTIARLYLLRYGAMTLFACIVGGLLAAIAVPALTSGIRANFADPPLSAASFFAPVGALLAVFALVMAICAAVLRAVGKMNVIAALVHGAPSMARKTTRTPKREGRSALAGARENAVGRRLAVLELRAEARQWALLPAVFFLTAILITLPMNLLSTFESPRFVTYMGAPESDVRADIQFASDDEPSVDVVHGELVAALRADPRVDSVQAYAGMLYETPGEDDWEALRIEVGDYSETTLVFIDGERPAAGQIALSVLNADKYQVGPGDPLTLRRGPEESTVTVSGIYQDVTSGGYTAKMQGEVASGADRWVLYADLAAGADPSAVAGEYDALSPTASVIPMRQYVQQTLSYATDALRLTTVFAFAFGLGSAVLITTLFLRLRLAKDRRKMGVLSAIGFSTREIAGQITMKTTVSVATGTALGVLFAATAGEAVVGGLISMSGMGIAQLSFIVNPWIVYAVFPLLLLAAGVISAHLLTARLRTADRSQWLR